MVAKKLHDRSHFGPSTLTQEELYTAPVSQKTCSGHGESWQSSSRSCKNRMNFKCPSISRRFAHGKISWLRWPNRKRPMFQVHVGK